MSIQGARLFEKYLDHILSPERNDFELMKFSSFLESGINNKSQNREIWFSRPSIFCQSISVEEIDMRINDILNEKKRRTSKSHEGNIEKHCPVAWDYYETRGDVPLYRGIKSRTDVLYGDSSENERKSANTTNHYTILFSEILPSWRSYPRRDRSWICTSDEYNAASYGSLYNVFPVGDPILGCMSISRYMGQFPPGFWNIDKS